MTDWLLAFALTLGVEVPIYLAILGLPWKKRLGAAFGTSLLTHPIVWFVLPVLLVPLVGYWVHVAISEAFAVVMEAVLCIALGTVPWRAVTASVVANAASFGLGYLLLS